jgi:hypothetical protein
MGMFDTTCEVLIARVADDFHRLPAVEARSCQDDSRLGKSEYVMGKGLLSAHFRTRQQRVMSSSSTIKVSDNFARKTLPRPLLLM